MKKLPYLAEELIELLDKEIPEKCPTIKMTDREIWTYTGARGLVRTLLSMLEEAKEEQAEKGMIL